MENASARNLWGDYLDTHLEHAFVDTPKVTHFYNNEKDADEAIKLISNNKRQITSHSLLGLQLRKEKLPKIGDFTIVTDWSGKAKCILRTTQVRLKPFFSIDDEHAALQGEGDKSLEQWKNKQWSYYQKELEPFGRLPRESMIVVCEKFEKVFER